MNKPSCIASSERGGEGSLTNNSNKQNGVRKLESILRKKMQTQPVACRRKIMGRNILFSWLCSAHSFTLVRTGHFQSPEPETADH